MNIKILSLAITIVAAASAGVAQDALAQEGQSNRGMRFNYAPNIWKAEQPTMPRNFNNAPAHAVRSGAVPKADSLLGFDPAALQPAAPPPPRVAPIARPTVQAVPSTTKVAGNYIPKPTFSPAFGSPTSMPPQQPVAPIAHAPVSTPPVQPVAPAHAAPPIAAKAPVVVARSNGGHHHHVSTGVSGRLAAARPKPTAAAAPQALSYDRGYVPGGSIAAGGTSGVGHSSTDVSGRILTHRKH